MNVSQFIKFTFLAVLFVTNNLTLLAQNEASIFENKNSVQLEFGGHGAFYSVNYERLILNKPRFKTTGQVGFSYYPPKTGTIDLWMPILVNELYSFGKHHIELGAGYIFTNEALRDGNLNAISRSWNGFLTGRIGYRYQKPAGRFLIRVAFTPVIEVQNINESGFHPLAGVSFGYSFGK
jgi:hypothetical protein